MKFIVSDDVTIAVIIIKRKINFWDSKCLIATQHLNRLQFELLFVSHWFLSVVCNYKSVLMIANYHYRCFVVDSVMEIHLSHH